MMGAGASLAGSTGTPEGFAATALSGTAPNNDFGGVSGMPNWTGGAGQKGRSMGQGEGMSGTILVQFSPLQIDIPMPDGSRRRVTQRMEPQRINLNANEDLQNELVWQRQGQ